MNRKLAAKKRVAIVDSYKRNSAAYWEGHAQFGSDEALRPKWFHDVGFDSGFEEADRIWYHTMSPVAMLLIKFRDFRFTPEEIKIMASQALLQWQSIAKQEKDDE